MYIGTLRYVYIYCRGRRSISDDFFVGLHRSFRLTVYDGVNGFFNRRRRRRPKFHRVCAFLRPVRPLVACEGDARLPRPRPLKLAMESVSNRLSSLSQQYRSLRAAVHKAIVYVPV